MSPEDVNKALRAIARDELNKEMTRVLGWFARTCDVAEQKHPEATGGLRMVRGIMENFKMFYGGLPEDPPPVTAAARADNDKLLKPKEKRLFTEEEKNEIIRAYQAGENVNKLCVRFGRTRSTIMQMLQRNNVALKAAKIGPPVRNDSEGIYADFEAGMMARDIASKYGLSLQAVYQCLARHRKALAKAQGRPLAAAE